jgi:hypothetical protein
MLVIQVLEGLICSVIQVLEVAHMLVIQVLEGFICSLNKHYKGLICSLYKY